MEVIFFPSTTALFTGNKTKIKIAPPKIRKQHKGSIMHPLKVYSTLVTVRKSVDWLLREWSTELAALHQQEQQPPPQSYYHGGHQLRHEHPPHLFTVPSGSLISADLPASQQRSNWCMYLSKTGWSPWSRAWRRHRIYFCIRPFIPTARCAVLNQNDQLSVCNTNFLTWISCGHSRDLLKCL